MRRTIPFLVAIALVLFAAPAAATPPVSWEEHHDYTVPQPLLLEQACEDFDILWTATAEHRWTEFYDRSGDLTYTTLHFSFTGTLYNSRDLAKKTPYQGGAFWSWDAQPEWDLGTYHFTVTIDGRRVPLIAGVEKYFYIEDLEHWDYVFNGIFWFENMPVVCEALA